MSSPGGGYKLVDKILSDNWAEKESAVPERTDLNRAYTSSIKTLFKTNNAELGERVYYFAGDAINNWVKFGKYTKDSSIWIGYNTNNESNNFASQSACESSEYNINCHLLYEAGDDIYWRIIRTNEETTGGGVRLLYSGTNPETIDGYIGFSKFNSSFNDPAYLGYMYGEIGKSDSQDRGTAHDSAIKTYIDSWYEDVFDGTNYENVIDTKAIYCNDRSVGNSFDYASDLEVKDIYYGFKNRITEPSYACNVTSLGYNNYFNSDTDALRKNDRFSVDNEYGNGALIYNVALMTADEVVFAGGKSSVNNQNAWYYLNAKVIPNSITANRQWWTMSPSAYYGARLALSWLVYGSTQPGQLKYHYGVVLLSAVRPVLSLKSTTMWASGDGTASNPYRIVEN